MTGQGPPPFDHAAATWHLREANRLQECGELDAAERLYRQILRVLPRHDGALHRLGVIQLQRRNPAAAADLIAQSIAIADRVPDAHANLAMALCQLDRTEEAIREFDRAIALDGRFLGAFVARGNALVRLGRHVAALESFRRALALDPRDPAALTGQGNAQLELGNPAAALGSYERAVAVLPDSLALQANRATALAELGRTTEALQACDRILARSPADANTHVTRGNALLDLGRFADAVSAYDRAIAIDATQARAWSNRGRALVFLRRFEDALGSFDRALTLHPAGTGASAALLNLRCDRATVLAALQRHLEAGEEYEALLAAAPDLPFVLGRVLQERRRRCDWRDNDDLVDQILAGVTAGRRVDLPFSFLAVTDSVPLQAACAGIFAGTLAAKGAGSAWRPRSRRRGDRLRIAYLSADFHDHATSQLAVGLFEAHDRTRFEVTALSFGPDDGSPMRNRVMDAFEHFIDVTDEPDEASARRLAELDVDIAIDLKGFTLHSRPRILAARPAPVQVSYLGYPGTMGVDWIDYLVADGIVIPESLRSHYREALAILPGCYQANHATRQADPAPSRAEAGLPPDGFVFACFNASYKISPRVFDVWMRLLATVSGSVLWLLESDAGVRSHLRAEAVKRGIAAERLVFAPRTAPAAYLGRQALADLFLDTFPVNAHTTASDALWMGLPVLTLAGDAFASRVAASLLTAVGLNELVTMSLADYETMACALASQPERLAELRRKLGAARASSGLFDSRKFCLHFERALEVMWARHERGEAPATFTLPDESPAGPHPA
jgi:protein O-GlcNAc transferase